MQGDVYFNVYLCHLCQTKESFFHSKLCSGCKLISYCGREHQRAHWNHHKDFCKAVQKLCAANSLTSGDDLYTLFETDDTMSPKDAYEHKTKNFMIHFEILLNRTLDRLEIYITLNPKKCQVCYLTNKIKKELVCRKCCTVAYCSEEHQTLGRVAHEEKCKEFHFILEMEKFYRNPIPFYVRELKFKSIDLKNLDMQRFIKQHLNSRISIQQESALSYDFTAVLTFAYAMKHLPSFKERKTLTVHIVGARLNFELSSIDQWKYLTIFFGNLQIITLVLVGPELFRTGETQIELFGPPREEKESNLIHCQSHNCKYHEAFNNGLIGKPDVIVAFNSGLWDPYVVSSRSWDPTISLFPKLKVPMICTAYMKDESRWDLERISNESQACGVKIKVLADGVENPFRRLRPFRFRDSVAYKNHFLSVIDFESD